MQGKRNYKTATEEEINKGQCSASDLREDGTDLWRRGRLDRKFEGYFGQGYFEKLLIYSRNNE